MTTLYRRDLYRRRWRDTSRSRTALGDVVLAIIIVLALAALISWVPG